MARDLKEMGFFSSRTQESITVTTVGDRSVTYEILKFFPFTSERKAMSVLVKRPDGRKFIYTKGADSSLLKMSDGSYNQLISDEVEELAKKGLRTLVFGYRELTTAYADLESMTAEEVETNLVLVGVTGVEDLLQENVKQCIEDFRDAGIKVWMLTGDKGATAKEIAYSCGLLTKEIESEEQIVRKESLRGVGEQTFQSGIFTFLNKFNNAKKLNEICPPIER